MTMNATLFQGERVRLAAVDPEKDAELFTRWERDSEYWRLLNMSAPRLQSAARWKEELGEPIKPDFYLFGLRTLADDRLIGFSELELDAGPHANGWIGIGIGERDYWDKGCGTDGLRLMVRFAFDELNLHRLSLAVFDYNLRAVHLYAKLGFAVEGRVRQALHRDGQRADMLVMGLLREDWAGREARR